MKRLNELLEIAERAGDAEKVALLRFAVRVEARLTNSRPEQIAGDVSNALCDLRDALEEAIDEA